MRTKVEWKEKTTSSGIELAGGPTTIERTGWLINSFMFPAPSQGGMGFIVTFLVEREDTHETVIVNGMDCKTYPAQQL